MEKSVDRMTDPDILALIGGRLRALRKAEGLSVAEVRGLTGLNPDTIYRAERGEGPSLATIVRLLRAYDRLSVLESFIPEPQLSPMELLRKRGKKRG